MSNGQEKEPRWFQFWKKSNREQVKAIERLTTAIYELEKTREEANKQISELLTNPERFAELIQSAISPRFTPLARPAPRVALGVTAGQNTVQILPPSPEAIREAVDTVTKAVLDKMKEMEEHIAEAVSELPPGTLEKIAEKIKAGEEFKLRRRQGCVHIDFGTGDDEYYLRL